MMHAMSEEPFTVVGVVPKAEDGGGTERTSDDVTMNMICGGREKKGS